MANTQWRWRQRASVGMVAMAAMDRVGLSDFGGYSVGCALGSLAIGILARDGMRDPRTGYLDMIYG